ncbi:MAG TPA: hypothetical protein VGC42_09310 [Kofleriaceae bacterium]
MIQASELDTPGGRQLAWLEREVDHLRMSWADDVAIAMKELRALDAAADKAYLLSGWALTFHRATTQLLAVISRDAELSLELSTTLLGCRAAEDLSPDYVLKALATAFPRLESPWRDAAADRAGVRHILKIAEGEGYAAVTPPRPEWCWPRGKMFPAADTVEGIQARLNYLDFGCGPVTGTWDETTQRAFIRWQISVACEPVEINPTDNQYDLDSRFLIEMLGGLTPDAPS